MTRSPAIDAVIELQQVLGWLAANLLPGTAKPYRAPQMSAEKREELNRAARESDFLEYRTYHSVVDVGTGVIIPLGESPVPVDLDVMDLLAEIMTAADEMCDLVSLACRVPSLPPASSAFADPGPYLRRVLVLLPDASAVHRSVEDICDGLIFRAHTLLGLLGDGQLLEATCPFCGGRTAHHPVGGARTLRVRVQFPNGRRTGTPGVDARWLVVCEGSACSPSDAECGERFRGHPAWNLGNEGGWLAERIEQRSAALEAVG